MLSLKLFGGASLERAGTPAGGRAARGHRLALLALLASGRTLTRDRVLALLWPESDTDRGRRFLSDTLYILRTALGEEVVLAPGDELRLNPAVLTTDVAEFERLITAGELEAAAALWTGPFLDGFHLNEGAEFEAWVEGERTRLAERYDAALEGLAAAAESGLRWDEAVVWWRRRAVRDPASGRVALRLMTALDRVGDRAGALQHARVHAALLRAEYDAEPEPQVTELAERLRREPAARMTVPVPLPATSIAGAAAALPAAPRKAIELPVLAPATREVCVPVAALAPRRWRSAAAAAAFLVMAGTGALTGRAGIAAAVGLASADAPASAPASSAAPERRSIAVLPFRNLSTEPERDYFSDGLAEELIGALGRVHGLRVAARTSSFAVGDELDARAIGETLGVATLLEGSVRRDGGRLRVGARLVDAASGYQLWSADYDRDLRDVFAVQDEIARAIVAALELTLEVPHAGTGGPAAARATPLIEAHDLYLRGVHLRNQLTNQGLSRAVDYFDRAIQLDSSYALAYAGKASALPALVWYRFLPRDQGLPAMRAATRRALELDPTLGEAHVAAGMLAFYFEWDWHGAERAFARAIELNPNDPHAHHMYANCLVAMGRVAEGIAARRRALALDPLSTRSGVMLARDLFIAGEHDGAIAQYLKVREIDSTSPLALGRGQEGSFGVGDVYARMGRDADAMREYLRLARLEAVPPEEIERMRRAFAAAGLAGYWRARLNFELRTGGTSPDPLRMASLTARTGDAEQTVRWLERAWRERSMALAFIGVTPVYDEVRGDPRVQAVIRRMKLPEAPTGRSAR